MAVRVITLLFAVVVMTASATSSYADLGSVDDVAAIDDSPDVDTPVMPTIVDVAAPDRPVVESPNVFPAVPVGRMHAVTVFRPPRLFASR